MPCRGGKKGESQALPNEVVGIVALKGNATYGFFPFGTLSSLSVSATMGEDVQNDPTPRHRPSYQLWLYRDVYTSVI